MNIDKTILKKSLIALVSILILLFVFNLGIFLGYRKASFYYKGALNYGPNIFGQAYPPDNNAAMPLRRLNAANDHGAVGNVILSNLSPDKKSGNIIIENKDGIEESILISPNTVIRKNNAKISAVNINLGDSIVVLGSPNASGQIQADFIRINR